MQDGEIIRRERLTAIVTAAERGTCQRINLKAHADIIRRRALQFAKHTHGHTDIAPAKAESQIVRRHDRMQAQIKPRHDPEIAAATTDRPEQIVVSAGAKVQHFAIGGHDLRANDIVARGAIKAARRRASAGQRQSGHADLAAGPHRRDQPLRRGCGQQLPDAGAAAHRCNTALRVNHHPVECAQIDLQRAIGHAPAGMAGPPPRTATGKA